MGCAIYSLRALKRAPDASGYPMSEPLPAKRPLRGARAQCREHLFGKAFFRIPRALAM